MKVHAAELKTRCSRLVYGVPKPYSKAKKAFDEILPLLESDKKLFENRGKAMLLAKKADAAIAEGTAEFANGADRNGNRLSGILTVGGSIAVLCGNAFNQMGGWCANILRVGGASAIIYGIGLWMKRRIFDFASGIEFPVQARLFLEKLEKHLGERKD